jgi:hypothetical protein
VKLTGGFDPARYPLGHGGHNDHVRRRGSPRRLAFIGVILFGAIVALGVLASVTSSGVPHVSTTHFRVAQYVPTIPQGHATDEPTRGIDPGMMGWSTTVMGKLSGCSSHPGAQVWVALERDGQVAAGEFVNAEGGYALGFQWPDHSVNGGPPVLYNLVASNGASVPVTLALDETTYVDLSC